VRIRGNNQSYTKMKKSTFLAFLGLWLTTHSFAQAPAFSIGIKGGTSVSWLIGKDFNSSTSNLAASVRENWSQDGQYLGFHLGFFSQINFAGFVLQPEVVYSRTAGGIKITGFDATGAPVVQQQVEQQFNRIDVPLLFGKRLGPVRLMVGPVVTWVISSGLSTNQLANLNLKESFQPAAWGYQLGAGVDFWRMTFDVRFEGGISDLGGSFNAGGNARSISSRNNQLIFSLGYRLIKTN